MTYKGYIHVEPQLGNYIHGDGLLGTVPLVPNGQWDAFLPPIESQASNNFEPFCCVSEATIHCIETLALQEYGNTMRRSVRFLASNSGTGDRQGNDPQTVSESLRTAGTTYETDYPFSTPDLKTFYQTLTRALKSLAIGEFAEFAYGHSWVTDTSQQVLMDALTYSPLSAAGFAWNLNSTTGYYTSPPDTIPEHDFEVYGFIPNNYWKVRDSYPDSSGSYDKKLDWDYKFTGVKRHTIQRQVVNQTAWQKFINQIKSLIRL